MYMTPHLTDDIICNPGVLIQHLEEDWLCDIAFNLIIEGYEGIQKLCVYIKQEGACLDRKDGVKIATDGFGVLLFLADFHHYVGV